MTDSDLQLLKSSVGKSVQIITSDGEQMVAKIISVFDEESDPDMTEADLECLKSHIDRHVELVTRSGERLLITVISVFDGEPDPDVFFWDVTADPAKPDSQQTQGYSLPLAEIVSVKPV